MRGQWGLRLPGAVAVLGEQRSSQDNKDGEKGRESHGETRGESLRGRRGARAEKYPA